MNVSKVARAGKTAAGGSVPTGAFNWATVYQYDEKESGRIKCACLNDLDIYTGTPSDGVKRWNVTSGG